MTRSYPTPNYKNRKDRNNYLLKLIKKNFSDINTILNLGGGQKRHLENSNYNITEIDISGDNDITLDLDKITKIPLEDNSFDSVVALDVLEHLENIHLILNEMNRLSNKYIFISLPNCFGSFFEIIFNKKKKEDFLNDGFYNKFYGLPLEKPLDRHRWFFTVSDIERMFNYFGRNNNLNIEYIFKQNNSTKAKLLGFFLNKRLRKEILTEYVWILINKNQKHVKN